MTWEPAEKVQKNAAGEYRALIGGEWVPVAKAQKSASGAYRIDRGEQAQPAQPERSTIDQLGRQAGLTARYGIEGLGDVVGIVQNPLSVITGGAIPRAQDVYPALATRMGLPQPETEREQLVGAASRGVVGAGTMIGAGGAVSQVPGLVGQVGRVLAAQPAAQIASAAGGAGGAELARQEGAGAGGQLAAGLVGSIAPSALATVGRGAAMIPAMLKTADDKYVVPPSQMAKPTHASRMLETISGKAKTEQAASVKNQAITNQKVLDDLSMPKDTQLSPELLSGYRARVFDEGYSPIIKSGTVNPDSQLVNDLMKIAAPARKQLADFPDSPAAKSVYEETKSIYGAAQKPFSAESALTKIKELREQASKAYKADDTTIGKAYKDIANAMEDQLSRHLERTGAPQDAIKAFKTARANIAKSHTVEEALVPTTEGSFNIDARKLARMRAGGAPLSGGMKEAAKQAAATPKSMVVPVAGATNPLSLTDVAMGGMYGIGGGSLAALASGSPVVGALLGLGLPVARPIARGAILSQPYQRALMNQPEAQNRLSQLMYGMIGANQ